MVLEVTEIRSVYKGLPSDKENSYSFSVGSRLSIIQLVFVLSNHDFY